MIAESGTLKSKNIKSGTTSTSNSRPSRNVAKTAKLRISDQQQNVDDDFRGFSSFYFILLSD
jgi:hypothetical protein